MAKILAIGAHSDDIEFYAGGTIASMATTHEVVFVIATDGRHGTHNGISQQTLINKRKSEQKQAAKELQVQRIIHLDFEDSELEYYKKEFKNKLLDILVSEKPDIIFSFDPERQFVLHDDFHPDHRTIALLALDVILIDATLPSKGGISSFSPQIYLYNPYRINHIEDISLTLQKKMRALHHFASQHDILEKQYTASSSEAFNKFR